MIDTPKYNAGLPFQSLNVLWVHRFLNVYNSPTCIDHLQMLIMDIHCLAVWPKYTDQRLRCFVGCNYKPRCVPMPTRRNHQIAYFHSMLRSAKMMQAMAVIIPPTLINIVICSSAFTYNLQPWFRFPVRFT